MEQNYKNREPIGHFMALRVFNTLTRKKETFTSLESGKVRIYVCGPTVYDRGHLGHGRSAVAFDIIRRYLLYTRSKVTFVSNYTDIDDKLIDRAQKEGCTVKELAERMIPEYERDYAALGILKPSKAPKATQYIKEMVALIAQLEKKGIAYRLRDGVYYDTRKFKDYGKLGKQDLDELQAGARVQVDEEKRHPQDFVLWKFRKEGEPSWPSPWGEGRPGWHIECSAMVKKLLGETIDIHGGGQDLIFPHHEDEVAQSEAAHGKPLARYWLHNGFVTVSQEKMSKSLGNFFTLRDVLQKYDGKIVRYFLLETHYRGPVNYADTMLEQAKNSLQRLWEFMDKLETCKTKAKDNPVVPKLLSQARQGFEEGMDNDFDTSAALAAIFELVREVNRLMAEDKLSSKDAKAMLRFMGKIDTVLNVLHQEKAKVPKDVLDLVQQREQARKKKDWVSADRLREEIKKKGYSIDDTESGGRVKRL